MRLVRIAPFLTLLVLSVAARADDGFLDDGGAPRLLSKHPSIRMARERVVVEIRPQGYHVDATFVFHNEGPACSVRMGFPDTGEPNEFDPDAPGKTKPQASLKGFRSWVDGRVAKTALIGSPKDATTWHTKVVDFRRGATRTVRVDYDADGGGAAGGVNDVAKYIREAAYVLHTGALWRGPIGYAEVAFRFPKGTRLRPVALRRIKAGSAYTMTDWRKRPGETVVWKGFAKPTVHGRKLRFVRSAFEPKKADDVDVYFGYGHDFEWRETPSNPKGRPPSGDRRAKKATEATNTPIHNLCTHKAR